MLDNSVDAHIQWQKSIYWARSLVQHVEHSDHDEDVNLPHVEFTTPVYVTRLRERQFYEWANMDFLNHLEDVPSYVHVSYYFPSKLLRSTWRESVSCIVWWTHENVFLDGILRSLTCLRYHFTAACALPSQNPCVKCMSQYWQWVSTEGIVMTPHN